MTNLSDTARSLLALAEAEARYDAKWNDKWGDGFEDFDPIPKKYLAACAPETIAQLCLAYLDRERDAERYKWIRNNPNWIGFDPDFMPTEVDRAVDRAKESNERP